MNLLKTAIKLEKLRYRKWSIKRNRYVTHLRDAAYAVEVEGVHMLCLGSEVYPNLPKTANNEVYLYGFKALGDFKQKASWKRAYRNLRQELKRIHQQKQH